MLGHDRPLYLLPFDHRHPPETGMFDFAPPLTPAQKAAVADSKRSIASAIPQPPGPPPPPGLRWKRGFRASDRTGASHNCETRIPRG